MNPIADAVMGIITPILNKLVPDAQQRVEAEEFAYKQVQELNLAQIQLNTVEAASSNLFIAGWRPYLGWGCATAFLYSALFEPILRFTATVLFHYAGEYPHIDTALTLEVLFGMLGMAGLRTYDKLKGLSPK